MNPRLPVAAVLASLLLHSLFSAPLLLPGKTGPRTEITFVDLSAEAPAVPPRPATPPPKKAAPRIGPEKKVVVKKAPEPEKAVVPLQEVQSPPPPPEAVGEEPEKVADLPEEQPAEAQPAPVPQNEFALGMSRGYFNALGSGRTLLPEVKDYYLTMVGKINRQWWGVEADHGRLRQEVLAVVIIARNGLVVDGWIARSSGDPLMDNLVLDTIRASSPFPPLPEGFPDFFQAPIRLVPPFMSGLGSLGATEGNGPA